MSVPALAGLLFAAGVSPLSIHAQPTSRPTAAVAGPVAIDLVARDKKGNPVTDLQSSEVEITEGGANLRVTDLRLVKGSPAFARPVMLVFDQLVPGNAKTSREAAMELLKDAPAAGIAFAVFKVDGRLRLLQPFTTDREALKNAIGAATGDAHYEKEYDAAEKQLVGDAQNATAPNRARAQDLLAMMLDSQRTAQEPHVTPSIAALLAAARGPGDVPGSRVIIYFSQGLRYNVTSPETVRSIIDAANRNGVTIYSIDCDVVDPQNESSLMASVAMANTGAAGQTGVAAASGPAGATAMGPGMGSAMGEQMGRIEMNDLGVSGPPAAAVAQATGGSHLVKSADVRKGMQRIVEDLTSYYVASISVAGQASDGRFHPVKIKALRAGIVIRGRPGYFALRAAAPAFEPGLLQALAQPKLPADMEFHAAAICFEATAEGVSHSLVIEGRLADGPDAHLAVLAQVKDRDGLVIEKFSQDVGRPAAAGEQPSNIVAVHRHFKAPPGTYVLEAAVTDPASGKTGAQRTNFEIAAGKSGPGLSDIVLVRRIDPFNGDADTSDPLRCADGKVVPDLSFRLTHAANPIIALFFHVHKDLAAEPPVLSAEVRRDGNLIGTVPLSLNKESREETVPYLAKLGTKSLKAGAYELTVILQQGGAKTSQSVSFRLAD
jgi:VWFA-related protein